MACPASPWTLLRRKRYVFYCILFAALFVLTPLFYDVGLLRRKSILAKHKARKQQDVLNITGSLRGLLREQHFTSSSLRHVTVKPWSKIVPSVTSSTQNTDRRKTTRNIHLSTYRSNGVNTEIDDSEERRKHIPSLQRPKMPPRLLKSPPYHHMIDRTSITTSVPKKDTPLHGTLAQSRSDIARGQRQVKKLGVVILALMRSGSSFVSELLNNNRDFFYLFEPMWTLKHNGKYFFRPKGSEVVADLKGTRVNRFDREYNSFYERAKLQMLNGLFHCNFTGMGPYYASYLRGAFIGRNASRTVRDACRTARFKIRAGNRTDCPILLRNIPRFLTELCATHKHVAVKAIRVDKVDELLPLVEDPSLDLKIVHLIRDPRAIVASRLALSHPAAVRNPLGLQELLIRTLEADEICGWMERNVQYRDNLPQQLRGRYALVRYEDVAADPSTMAEKIYNFLGIPLPDEVTDWIEKNTKGHHHIFSKYQTNRNSQATLDTWRHKLVFSSVSKVQSRCHNIMTELGYRLVYNASELTNMTNILVEEPSPEIANLII
ncbi:carbohydrate sulfotransferase 1-like [Branchiostoma floridae]|uniref:Sulfotransferase n=1 Tax=Branchiostoma floridae TaxID=7739 RepID=A0A9J7N3T3_BRAFL|nr:carbohydrate sulfotransferase 1-like [Branchiostoma floridae]XP_035690771.1 carbohydrate sulfotransferase 1-like [Branchiostoma floridae]